MNGDLLWFVVGMIVLPLFLLVSYIVAVRMARYHSKKLYAGQPPPPGNEERPSVWKAYKKWFLGFGAIVLIVWLLAQPSSLQSPSLGDVWDWTKGHWLWILLALGVVALLPSLITFPKEKEKAAGALRKAVVVLLLVLWFVIPICNRIWGEKPPRLPQQQVAREKARALPHDAPDLPRAWNPDGSLTDVSKWPQVQVPPYGDSVHVPNIFGGHVVWGGSGFKVHCIYGSDGHEGTVGDSEHPCSDGNIVESYARNQGGTLLYASYAYARKGEK